MAWPVTTVLNISNSGYYWQDTDQPNTFLHSLTTEDIKSGTIDPYLLAATTILHLLVSASRRLLSTEPESTLENLTRIAAKPGVQSILVLSKADGSIIRSSGLLADTHPGEAPMTGLREAHDANTSLEGTDGSKVDDNQTFSTTRGGTDRHKSAEEVSRMVFSFMSAAKDFTEGMDQGDEVRLLRMRTRKNEIVIVPGQYQNIFGRCLRRLPLPI
ncbi:MAG: hypothetical protein Q9167_001926 [Letrouitia subvulpina]